MKSLVLRRHAIGDFGSLEYCGHSPVAQLAATACGRGVSGRTWCLKFWGMIVDRPPNTRRHLWRVEILNWLIFDKSFGELRILNSFRWTCFLGFMFCSVTQHQIPVVSFRFRSLQDYRPPSSAANRPQIWNRFGCHLWKGKNAITHFWGKVVCIWKTFQWDLCFNVNKPISWILIGMWIDITTGRKNKIFMESQLKSPTPAWTSSWTQDLLSLSRCPVDTCGVQGVWVWEKNEKVWVAQHDWTLPKMDDGNNTHDQIRVFFCSPQIFDI